uniref:protein-S-isoprenylcysteine alpha-carbonyl methylesterase n=1 Tax=Chlamydomonas euryale TaxID=1486919 RepID=A0A7R9YU06_9CHLO|mmetsp:Transcript_2284/g.6039  ORF Transcript_2284/g.6039 Transcript_2284/m.6039 type:complete len:290 (+) Transcript_2284:612-1481(+)
MRHHASGAHACSAVHIPCMLRHASGTTQAEMDTLPTLPERLRRLPEVLGILLSEVVGLFALIPYALSTMALYRSLPGPGSEAALAKLGVTVERDVAYGQGNRCLLDVYAPAAASKAVGDGDPEQPPAVPVIVFVHGGVWASGEKWHYAPMATRLAQEGYMVVVPSYELYPKALCPQMVRETSDALSWTLDNVGARGGDPAAVALVGHSAGAQLASMALLARASAAAAKDAAAAAGDAAGRRHVTRRVAPTRLRRGGHRNAARYAASRPAGQHGRRACRAWPGARRWAGG